MNERYRRSTICLSLAPFLSPAFPSVTYAQLPASSDACTGQLDGSRFPHVVPEQFAWEALFDATLRDMSVLSRDLGMETKSLQALSTAARTAKDRANALKEASIPGVELSADRDAEAAEAILDARDSLIRRLDPAQYNRLRAWVEKNKKAHTYTLAAQGQRIEAAVGPAKCVVSANGRETPHLIPETFYWEFYFRSKATVAQQNKDANGEYLDDYIAVVRRYHTRMPAEHVRTLLRVAEATTSRVDELRQAADRTPEGSTALEGQIAGVVMNARAELVRRLPVTAWLAVRQDARQEQTSSVVSFPPSR